MCNKKIKFPVEDNNEAQNQNEDLNEDQEPEIVDPQILERQRLDELLDIQLGAPQMDWNPRPHVPNVPDRPIEPIVPNQPPFLVRNQWNILATLVTSFGVVVTFFPQYTYQMLMLVSSVLATLYHDEVIGFCHAIYILIRLMYRSLRGQE